MTQLSVLSVPADIVALNVAPSTPMEHLTLMQRRKKRMRVRVLQAMINGPTYLHGNSPHCGFPNSKIP